MTAEERKLKGQKKLAGRGKNASGLVGGLSLPVILNTDGQDSER
jgi:hypothetical protein